MATLADAKCLSSDFLRELGLHDLAEGAVGIPYYDPAGENIAVKRRSALKATDGSYWPKGTPLAAYGQWRLAEAAKAGFQIVVEGESDCWALWFHKLPALGIPGANAVKVLELEHVEGVGTIYVHREPDRGGAAFVEGLRNRMAALGYVGKVFELRMPEGVKDPADLHLQNPRMFKERLEEAIRASTVLQLPSVLQRNGRAITSKAAPWPDPVPLGEIPEVLPFPIDVLPHPMRRLTEEVAWALNCPTDFVAVPLLALAGGALANSRHLAVTRTHIQAPCMYVSYVGRPGTSKSAPLKLLRGPFDTIQKRWIDQWRRQVKALEEVDTVNTGSRGLRPTLRRCIISDVTTESLGLLLEENPRGVVMVRNELSALVAGLNQYKGGNGHDRQVYLNLWDGDTLTIDRKSDRSRQGGPLYVTNPFTAIVGSIQPDVLGRLRGESVRGVAPPDDGFLDRFVFSYPLELPAVGEQWREVSEEALDAWREMIEKLLGLEMVAEEGRSRPFLIRLSSCGRQEWQRFTEAHADETNAADFPPHLFGPWSKLKGYAARLALIIHFLRWAAGDVKTETVDGESMIRAARLVAYFKSHARKVYNAMDADKTISESRRLLRWIVANRMQHFSKRDAFEGLKGTFGTVEKLDTVLAAVQKHGFIRPEASQERSGRGRKPSPIFEVHPSALETSSHNSHNSVRPSSYSADSANCANHFEREDTAAYRATLSRVASGAGEPRPPVPC